MDKLFRQETEIFSLGVDETAKAHLLETARWAKFLAILFIIVSAIMILLGIFTAVSLGSMNSAQNPLFGLLGGIGFAVLYFVFVGIYIYPVIALYQYSKLTNLSIRTSNQQQFNEALRYQRNMYKYMGVLMIIILSLYGISMVFGLIAVVMSGAI